MRKLLAGTALCLTLGAHAANAQSQYSSLTVFGDSLSANAIIASLSPAFVPAPPYYQGRFSNGPVYAEYLSNQLKISGPFTDLAVGGAFSGTLNETVGALPLSGTNLNGTLSSLANPNNGIIPGTYNTSVQGQILRYLSTNSSLPANGLYIVWGGANDYLTMAGLIGAQPSLSSTQVQALVAQQVGNTVTNLTTDVGMLAKAGAKTVIVPILPNLAATPSLNGSAASQQLGALATLGHNSALTTAMANLSQSTGVKIYMVDVAGILNDVIANPAKYGVSNTTTACVGTTSVCSNPSGNLFWDSVHPTAGIHQVLSQAVTATVTAPLVIGAQAKLADIAVQQVFDGVSSRIEALQQGASGFTLTAPGGAQGHVDSSRPVSFYVTGDFGVGDRHDEVNQTGFHYTNGGVQVGADYRADKNFAVGAQASFNSTGATLKDGMGSDDLRSYGIALYGALFGPNWWGSAAGFYSYQDYDKLNRNTNVVGQVAAGSAAGSAAGGKVEAGYMLHDGALAYGPLAELRYARVTINSYTEKGAVALNQSVDNQAFASVVAEIGGEIATEMHSGEAVYRPSLRAGWNHVLAPSDRDVFSRLASLSAVTIDTALTDSGKDFARVGAGLSVEMTRAFSFVASVDGTVGKSDGQDVSGMLKLLCNF